MKTYNKKYRKNPITSEECDDFKLCWSLDNLQPLWAIDNLKKALNIPRILSPNL